MRITDLPPYLESSFQYPVDRHTVIEEIGDMDLEGPHSGHSESIQNILERLEEDEYTSVDELFTTIVGTVSDQYIGRKYYDDRGANPRPPVIHEQFQDNESF